MLFANWRISGAERFTSKLEPARSGTVQHQRIQSRKNTDKGKTGGKYKSWMYSEEKKLHGRGRERPLRFLFLVWLLRAESTRFMANTRKAADPVKVSRLNLLSFFSLSIFSLFLSSCSFWTLIFSLTKRTNGRETCVANVDLQFGQHYGPAHSWTGASEFCNLVKENMRKIVFENYRQSKNYAWQTFFVLYLFLFLRWNNFFIISFKIVHVIFFFVRTWHYFIILSSNYFSLSFIV